MSGNVGHVANDENRLIDSHRLWGGGQFESQAIEFFFGAHKQLPYSSKRVAVRTTDFQVDFQVRRWVEDPCRRRIDAPDKVAGTRSVPTTIKDGQPCPFYMSIGGLIRRSSTARPQTPMWRWARSLHRLRGHRRPFRRGQKVATCRQPSSVARLPSNR